MIFLRSKRTIATVIGLFAIAAVLTWFGTETISLREEIARQAEINAFSHKLERQTIEDIYKRLDAIETKLDDQLLSIVTLYAEDAKADLELEELKIELRRFKERFR